MVEEDRLGKGTLSLPGVMAMSVGAMGISGVVALVVPLVEATSGSGGWLTWIVCTVVILMVAWCISLLARKFATTGGVYGFAAKGLGPFGGVTTGWIMVVVGGFLSSAAIIGFGIYASQFLTVIHIPANHLSMFITSAVCLAICWWAAFKGMKRSVNVMLGIEILTISVIAVVMIVVLFKHNGPVVDPTQLHLRGSSFHNVVLGIVLAVLAFAGFESAAVLGQEAKNPMRSIPTAMISAVIGAGIFWLFCGYVLFLGFQGSRYSLATSVSPLDDLARISGIAPVRYILNLSVALTLLASGIAVLNWVSRFMFTMSKETIALKSWSRLHAKYKTPHVAVHWLGTAWLGTIIIIFAFKLEPFGVLDDLGDLGGFGFMVVYALVVASAMVLLFRSRTLRAIDVVAGFISIASLGYVFYSNVVPFPTATDDIVTLVSFIAFCALVVVAYFVVKKRSPETISDVGSSVDADTALASGG